MIDNEKTGLRIYFFFSFSLSLCFARSLCSCFHRPIARSLRPPHAPLCICIYTRGYGVSCVNFRPLFIAYSPPNFRIASYKIEILNSFVRFYVPSCVYYRQASLVFLFFFFLIFFLHLSLNRKNRERLRGKLKKQRER